ncbi:TetR/AcrR family transcriptional regulator [Solimicrobium silvestre]|uniref:TetR/AcrR family transcriptional regulator n=1 Tax=Solimicrobium silvestre TaxID=2099400 RepID=UPI001A9C2B38|nr:TetR/AcrR family transcriptional regulator [Solimicrobium silvestre]
MHFQDTKQRILAVGESLIVGRGFSALGLSEILTTAKVPKGSFYHYFQSKEGFGVALLERYFSEYDERLTILFADQTMTMRERVMSYFKGWHATSAEHACNSTCLVVKLAAEVSDLSEPMRCALALGMSRITGQLAAALSLAQAEGSVSMQMDAAQLAEILYSMWVGASLVAKVKHDLLPLDLALQQTELLVS